MQEVVKLEISECSRLFGEIYLYNRYLTDSWRDTHPSEYRKKNNLIDNFIVQANPCCVRLRRGASLCCGSWGEGLILAQRAEDGDRSSLIGVGLMLLVAILAAFDAVIVRMISPAVHPFIIGFTRSLFGLLFVLPWIMARPGMLRSEYRMRHVLRAALKLASLIAFFFAYARASLADVTAIAFTAPIFVSVGAWAFLSERPRALRVAASICGFIGVLIVLRPSQLGGVSSGLLFALLGAILTAVIQLILKPMSAKDSTETLVSWNLILTVPIAVIPAIWVWVTPTPTEWAFLALQGALGALNMGLVTRAFSLADASLIAPMDFLRLPIVAGLAFVFFGQTVTSSTWLGAAVIFGATLLMAHSARGRKLREI